MKLLSLPLLGAPVCAWVGDEEAGEATHRSSLGSSAEEKAMEERRKQGQVSTGGVPKTRLSSLLGTTFSLRRGTGYVFTLRKPGF